MNTDSRSVAGRVVPMSEFLAVGCKLLAVGFLLSSGCAKKMLPPSPDRFPPHLVEIRTRTRARLELEFDEGLAQSGLVADSFRITWAQDSVLAIRGVTLSRKTGRIQLWTDVQSPKTYVLTGVVRDTAKNVGRFRARFVGSTRVDTIAPRVTRVTPAAGTGGVRSSLVTVEFSEEMDTTGGQVRSANAEVRIADHLLLVVPARLDTLVRTSWDADWQSLTIGILRETSGDTTEQRNDDSDTTQNPKPKIQNPSAPADRVYVLLLPGLEDLEGNVCKEPAFTCFTADSAFGGVNVKGEVQSANGEVPSANGVVFFDGDVTKAFAPLLSDWSFSALVLPGTYEVRAVADTNSDGLVDLAGTVPDFSTKAESLKLTLSPVESLLPIHVYRR